MRSSHSGFFITLIFSFDISILSTLPAIQARDPAAPSAQDMPSTPRLGELNGRPAFALEIFLPAPGKAQSTDLTFLSIRSSVIQDLTANSLGLRIRIRR